MPSLDLTALRSAIQSLQEGLGVVQNQAWFAQQHESVRNTLLAGVIQNFEFVYEISVKMIRRQLELESDSPSELDQAGFKDMLRMASERGLIDHVEAWFGFRQMRNITAHTYDHAKALQVYHGTQNFLTHAQAVLLRLEGRGAPDA